MIADDLTPEQVKAYRLADNKTAELSGWDFPALEDELAGILEIDMSDFGFDEEQDLNINDFFDDSEPKEKEPKRVQCPHCGEWFEI